MKKWTTAFQLLAVGFYVQISLLIPTGIGFWLDRRGGHDFPSFTLGGLGIGTVIMVYGVYQMVRPFLNEAKREEAGRAQQKIPKVETYINSNGKTNKKER